MLFLSRYRWQQFVESDAIPVGPAEKAAFLWPLLSGVQLKALSQSPVTNDCVSSQCVTLTNQQFYCHFQNQCFLLVSSVQFPTAMRINSNICVTSVVIQRLYNIWSFLNECSSTLCLVKKMVCSMTTAMFIHTIHMLCFLSRQVL